MRYYFYCPKCGFEKIVAMLPKGTAGNSRGGFGTPIHHFECSKCHNLDAGYMGFVSEPLDDEEKEYFQNIISMYQNIRGYAGSG